MFPPVDYSAMYLSRMIAFPRDTSIALSLGSDDGIKVWLDGIPVFSHNIERGAAPGQEFLDLRLSAGTHQLLLKVANGQGPTGFYFALSDREVRAIWDALARDFPAQREQREMTWEQEDSVWAMPWIPGDVSILAGRYAAATLFSTPRERDSAVAAAANIRDEAGLERARAAYIASRVADITPRILTPPPPEKPRVNGPSLFGVRPGHPFLYTIPATGVRPMTFSVRGLPSGLRLDAATGRITGMIDKRGTFPVTFVAKNSKGIGEKRFTIVCGETIALTPALGWNSWNCFAEAVDESRVRSAAGAMISSGLVNHGWTYINIDDCWEIKPGSTDPMVSGEPRSADGKINTNRKFPDMKALADEIHAKGLKIGIYSSPGPLTCAGYTASYQHERDDALRYADWGIDYLKYDWCSYSTIEKTRTIPALQKPYFVMRDALNSVRRDIVYSLCQYGWGNVWEWGAIVGGNSWRTTGDIEDTWESMSRIGFSQAGHERFAGPGKWNDPDMLVVGMVGWGPRLHPTRLTPNEQYTHITLWSLLSSPLLIGCDMTRMDDFTLSLLTNDEVLAVNQDAAGNQAGRMQVNGDCEVWAKQMADGSRAVGLFNRGRWNCDVTVSFAALGLKGEQRARDLWRQKDIGVFADSLSRNVPRHGAVLLRLTGPR
jgi:alpha-galactosidase